MNLKTFVLPALALGLCLAGCGPSGQPDRAQAKRLFVISLQTLNNPFFIELNKGLAAEIEKRGDRLVTLDSQFNSLKQRNDLSDLLQQQPDAIFINPVNWEGIRGTLLEAKRRKVPVIVVDAPVSDPDLVLCQVASDNVEAGRLACEALAKIKPKARIVILHLSVNKACIDRVAGFTTALALHPNMEILDTLEGKGSTEGSRPVMRDLLARYPELDGVFAINDPSALGCISAIESANRGPEIAVVTVDGSHEGLNAILSGKLHSTVAQYPREIGRLAAESAYAHLAGQSVAKDQKVPVKLITKEEAAAFLAGH